MLLLRGFATCWVADQPFPGLVEIAITDVDGRRHRFREKASVVDPAGLLNAHTRYPVEVQIACLARHQAYRPGETQTVNVVDLSPWGVGERTTLYPVRREQLSWTAPALYSDLSVAARQAVALVTFHRWREAVGLNGDEFAALEEQLWQFAMVTPDTFKTWYESNPLLLRGWDDPMLQGVRDDIEARGLVPEEVERAVEALAEITYDGLFAGIKSESSLNELEALGRFTARHGIPLIPPDGFIDSLWIDRDWGQPDLDVVTRWRATE